MFLVKKKFGQQIFLVPKKFGPQKKISFYPFPTKSVYQISDL